MSKFRKFLPLIIILVVIAAPAAIMTSMYYVTKDPRLRPLGVTKEALKEVEQNEDFDSSRIAIRVHVNWGQDRTGTASKADLRQLISRVLDRRTEDYFYHFKDVPGTAIEVTFVVGPNRYGPYPPNRVLDGIVPALLALDMTLKAKS